MNRKRRYLLSAAVLAACVGIALGVLAMLPPQPGVTKANFDRIEKGMTFAEVLAILGVPEIGERGEGNMEHFAIAPRHDDGTEIVVFFHWDKVSGKEFSPSTETIFEKVRRLLHL